MHHQGSLVTYVFRSACLQGSQAGHRERYALKEHSAIAGRGCIYQAFRCFAAPRRRLLGKVLLNFRMSASALSALEHAGPFYQLLVIPKRPCKKTRHYDQHRAIFVLTDDREFILSREQTVALRRTRFL